MTDLIKDAPVVKIATVRAKDLEQMDRCLGLTRSIHTNTWPWISWHSIRIEDGQRILRELKLLGWFKGDYCVHALVELKGGRLQVADVVRKDWIDEIKTYYPQLFIR